MCGLCGIGGIIPYCHNMVDENMSRDLIHMSKGKLFQNSKKLLYCHCKIREISAILNYETNCVLSSVLCPKFKVNQKILS